LAVEATSEKKKNYIENKLQEMQKERLCKGIWG
jgi:hypothetical protein